MSKEVLLENYIRSYIKEVEEQRIIELLENNELNEGLSDIVNSIKNFAKSTSTLERILLTGIAAGFLGVSSHSLGINDSSGTLNYIANKAENNAKNLNLNIDDKKVLLNNFKKELSQENIKGIATLLGIEENEAEFLSQGGNPIPELFKVLLKNKSKNGPIASYEDEDIRLTDKFLNTQEELEEYLRNPEKYSSNYKNPENRIFNKLSKVISIGQDKLYNIINGENNEELKDNEQDLFAFLKEFLEKRDKLASLEIEYNNNPDSEEAKEAYVKAWVNQKVVLEKFCSILEISSDDINAGLINVDTVDSFKTLISNSMF